MEGRTGHCSLIRGQEGQSGAERYLEQTKKFQRVLEELGEILGG
jgi:hypothetical protein